MKVYNDILNHNVIAITGIAGSDKSQLVNALQAIKAEKIQLQNEIKTIAEKTLSNTNEPTNISEVRSLLKQTKQHKSTAVHKLDLTKITRGDFR